MLLLYAWGTCGVSSSLLISIHLMLLLYLNWIWWTILISHFNTSNVTVIPICRALQPATNTHFNTSNVTVIPIRQSLLPITILYFNTSNVTVIRIYSWLRRRWYGISIHLMLLLYQRWPENGISSWTYFNTSNVTVIRCWDDRAAGARNYFNTSNVTVILDMSGLC